METPIKCPLTGERVVGFAQDAEEVRYSINVFSKAYHIIFCRKCFAKIIANNSAEEVKHLIKGFLINNKINTDDNIKRLHWIKDADHPPMDGINLYEVINNGIYPRNPGELLKNLLKEIFISQDFSGQTVPINESSDLYYAFYFKNKEQFNFYLNTLHQQGYIDVKNRTQLGFNCQMTYKGLEAYSRFTEEGFVSTICFVAMSFSVEHMPLRLAIKTAIENTGFDPLIVDEQYNPTNRTINDQIIAGIKKAKFCIADFCDHRNGVYFEAGFALGLGKPVIFTCHNAHKEQRHFDISPMHTIFYDNENELTEKLTNYINAWIR